MCMCECAINNSDTHTHTAQERDVKHETEDLVKERQNVEEE